ncbi:MAG: choice-of-anchor Q domain-containing protein [Candidatus Wenzhouxiangella sp. M2_3B_020]
MHPTKVLLHAAASVSLLGPSGLSQAATLTYPGGAPCDGSLQACLDGAAAGDIVELATNGPIDEDLAIAKSLTVRAADGFAPVVGSGADERSVNLCSFSASETAPISVALEGLTFDMAVVRCQLGSGQPHHQLTIRNSTFNFIINEPGFPVLAFNLQSTADIVIERNVIEFAIDHNGVAAIGIDVRNAAAAVDVADNQIASTGAGVSIFGLDASSLQARVSRNRITASDPANNGIGIEFDFRNGGTYSAAALSNVIYGVGGCNCGRNSGIHVTTPSFTGEATFSITNNTITATQARAQGLLAVLQGTGYLTLNLYNNNLSRNGGSGFSLNSDGGGQLSINADGNNSFDNDDSFLNVEPIAPTGFDPLFVDEATHDYRLRADSPLIDIGIDDPIGGTTELDAEGDFRRSGAAIDIGAYEFAAVAPRFYTDRRRFLSASEATPASAPFVAANAPPEPFTSGDVVFDAIHPSTLHFGSWPADFPRDNNVELAINDKEDLDITMAEDVVYAMGIDFDDPSGGSTPSTFEVRAKTKGAELVRFEFRTQEAPEENYIGIWSREPFDRIEIRETTTANENEFFGTVAISREPMPWFVFENGFER